LLGLFGLLWLFAFFRFIRRVRLLGVLVFRFRCLGCGIIGIRVFFGL
jgi:hypothetical protein